MEAHDRSLSKRVSDLAATLVGAAIVAGVASIVDIRGDVGALIKWQPGVSERLGKIESELRDPTKHLTGWGRDHILGEVSKVGSRVGRLEAGVNTCRETIATVHANMLFLQKEAKE